MDRFYKDTIYVLFIQVRIYTVEHLTAGGICYETPKMHKITFTGLIFCNP